MVNAASDVCGKRCSSVVCRGAKGILGALEWIGLRGADREGHGIERLQDVQAQAMRGDTFAILDLGNRLVNGDMVPQNYEQVRDFKHPV